MSHSGRLHLVAILVVSVFLFSGCPNLTGPAPVSIDSATVPNLSVLEWITPPRTDVDHNRSGHVIVLEFWATWCEWCRDSIPHLNEISQLYGDNVTVIAVTDENPVTVARFVKSMGDAMTFAVAIDDRDKTWNAYMAAYGQSGIPHAFVIVDGEVVDHRHPMGITTYLLDGFINP